MEPFPYNITVSSQTGTILYLPSRDGNASLGWNVTYSQGTSDTGYNHPQGVGVDSHQTTYDGATMQFSWIGTAMFLYGQADGASYTIDVDGDQSSSASVSVPQGGLLGSRTGLIYGNHTLTLTTHGTGQVSFQYAELTIGVGYPGSLVQNRTILAVDSASTNPTPNPYFTYQPGNNHWQIEDAKSQRLPSGVRVPVPLEMFTATVGESVSFTVNQTTAFFLYASFDFDRGQKIVTVTPYSDPSKVRTTAVTDFSNALDFVQILYWEAGLDRDESYNVQIIQVGLTPRGGTPNFRFHTLVTIDGGSPNASGTPGSGIDQPGKHRPSAKLGPGALAGIVISCVAVLMLLGGVVLWVNKRRK
ncbi:hypothetical protein BXZ70DRAFT_179619 [Cristinia sonorae]|uniref:Uncharacterized protein n=1 Tax=Cristinia sonorae TaxID=1940300 RepID=A0A8K0UP59_9AGAR|nr:hypothetical protein BXZ70DRAFT_179619 [Cristinia sonorae]